MANEIKSHWKGKVPDIDTHKCFVYEITNLVTGMKYIGRKQMWYLSKKKSKKTGKRMKIQHQWKSYTGSSKALNSDIEELGKDKFSFKIVKLYKGKSGVRYGETELIVKRNALTKNRDLYYNGRVDSAYQPNEYYDGAKRIDAPREYKKKEK